jgi:hypothetical protein
VVDARGTVRPVRAAIHDLVDDLPDRTRRLGCEDELALVLEDPRARCAISDSVGSPPGAGGDCALS